MLNRFSLFFLLFFPVSSICQQVNADISDYYKLWESIELTSKQAKIIPASKAKFPLWIPVSIGTGAAVTTILLVGKNDSVSDVIPLPIARDDIYQMMCGMSAQFTPLENDSGEVLFISAISGNPDGVTLLNETTIQVNAFVLQSFSLRYTLTDKNGNTASASVTVNIQVPVLTVSNQNIEVISGQLLTGNILTGSDCPQCRITNATGASDGTFEWNENGIYTIKIDNLSGSPGTYNFIFQITGKCGITTSASLTVVALPKTCDIELTSSTTSANCDMDDGSIIINNIDGTYRLLWNTGSEQSTLAGISAGNYMLTITNVALSCTKSFSFTLGEKMAEYIGDIMVSPGNCYQSGQAVMDIVGFAAGPFIVNASGPAGSFIFEVPAGVSDIAALIGETIEGQIITGHYNISIRDKSKDMRCTQSFTVLIPEEDVKLQLIDDSYSANENMALTGNILDNDTGTGLKVSDIQIPPGVVMEWNADGNFSFVGNAGQYELIYTAIDTCGRTATATINILVENIFCDYQVTFTVTPALCGAANGNAFALVLPAATGGLLWSNGTTGTSLTNVTAGVYSLTVIHPSGACQQTFSVNIPQTVIPYVNQSTIIQQNCNHSPEAILNLSAPVSGFITIVAIGPASTATINVPQGNVLLSNFVNLIPGLWTLVINDAQAPPICAQNLSFELIAYVPPILTLLDIEPPSSPTAKDGIVFVNITGGQPPYAITGPGQTYTNLMPGFNALPGFPSGLFTLFAVDAEGCKTLPIVVEMFGGGPSFKPQISTSFNLPYLIRKNTEPEHPKTEQSEIHSIQFQMVNVSVEVRNYFGTLTFGRRLSIQKPINPNSSVADLNLFAVEGGRRWTYRNLIIQGGVHVFSYKWKNEIQQKTVVQTITDFNLNTQSHIKINAHIDLIINIAWYPSLNGWTGVQTVRYNF